jgi:hypothetical protein
VTAYNRVLARPLATDWWHIRTALDKQGSSLEEYLGNTYAAGQMIRRADLFGVSLKYQEVTMTAKTDDYDEIVRVMRLYVDGFNDNEIANFKEAFVEDAWIFNTDANGNLRKNLISESFERWAAPPSRGFVGRFISVTQVGDAASVQLSLESTLDKSDSWIDFHNLLRINGVWKITNKTATHSSR